ncbi:acyltransferase domain-containing protein [Streptomyces sp. NPDC050560]|uniref:acyltransferase domain-containing protein n=1 Tax=Streptomyces sp. NPDC050560 TaxID=3365630 RepID=UPI0037B17CD3
MTAAHRGAEAPAFDADAHAWAATLAALPATGPARTGPEPCTDAQLAARMDLLDVPERDRDTVLRTWPGHRVDGELWRALCACHRALFDDTVPPSRLPWPDAPARLGAHGRHFYVHLCLAALPRLLETHRRLGVDPRVTRDTVADVGAKMATYRLAHRTGGLDRQRWLVRHFRATLFRVGRLQFDRAVLAADAYGGAPPDGPADGEHVLELHIPGDGPLTPGLCDASLREGARFFATHFPGERHTQAVCRSWLLDEQLAALLPPTSNILGFQRRFTLFGASQPCDDAVLEFVFHAPPGTADLARLPRRTTLQRAVLTHLEGGGHFRQRCGRLPLP